MAFHKAQLHYRQLRPYISGILVKISEYIQETEIPDVLFCHLPGINIRFSVPMQHWHVQRSYDHIFFLFGCMILHRPMIYLGVLTCFIFKKELLLSLVLFISTLYCSWYLSSMLAHIHHLSTHLAAPITFAFHLTCCMNRHKNPCCRGQPCAINIFCSGPGNGSFGSMRRSFCLVQWNAKVWK